MRDAISAFLKAQIGMLPQDVALARLVRSACAIGVAAKARRLLRVALRRKPGRRRRGR